MGWGMERIDAKDLVLRDESSNGQTSPSLHEISRPLFLLIDAASLPSAVSSPTLGEDTHHGLKCPQSGRQ